MYLVGAEAEAFMGVEEEPTAGEVEALL